MEILIAENDSASGDHHVVHPGRTSGNEPGYFKSVCALPEFHLKITMGTNTAIHFDFRSRLNTARFGKLRDEAMFRSVCADGVHLIFCKEGKAPAKITAKEFMDLVLVDRTKISHGSG